MISSAQRGLPVALALLLAVSLSAAPVAPNGDPISGRALFTGARSFDARGPQCFACHTAAGTGLFGGGALGPDLTGAGAKYGAGLANVLANVPFPTMKPLYANRPLNEAETADLVAFIRQAGSALPAPSLLFVIALSVDGLAGLYVLFSLLWRGRVKSVRDKVTRADA
jgi:ubiquinol-cytochrome c reductase cytochrome c subunit